MEIGSLIALLKLLQDTETTIGPPAPNGNGETPKVKPNCGPGYYATFNTSTDQWECEVIPKGR